MPPTKPKHHKNKLQRVKAGMTFGKLTILRKVSSPKGVYGYSWKVQCNCASASYTIREAYLFRALNPLRHCGCENKGLPTLHKREYNSWIMMNTRCNDPKHVSFAQYGGRGITVCAEWHKGMDPHAFYNFLRDMGPRPKGKTLDRRNNDLGYYKDNCRWATPKEQGNNKRCHAKPLPPPPLLPPQFVRSNAPTAKQEQSS